MLIRHLPYFVIAAEEQNLAKAAERLNMSASALTRRIQNLEHELGGVQLFDRRQSGISLTAAGRAFLEDIEAPLDQLERAAKRAERLTRGDADALRLGYNPISLRQEFLRDALASFRESYPDIQLELVPMVSQHQADALRSGELDAGILSVPIGDEGFGVESIEDFPMLLTLHSSHPKAEKAALSLADLEGEKFVGITRKWFPGVYDSIASQFETAGIEQQVVCETHCDATMSRLIGLGVGVGFVTPAESGPNTEALAQRVVEDFSASLPLMLIWRERRDGRIGKLVRAIGDALPH